MGNKETKGSKLIIIKDITFFNDKIYVYSTLRDRYIIYCENYNESIAISQQLKEGYTIKFPICFETNTIIGNIEIIDKPDNQTQITLSKSIKVFDKTNKL